MQNDFRVAHAEFSGTTEKFTPALGKLFSLEEARTAAETCARSFGQRIATPDLTVDSIDLIGASGKVVCWRPFVGIQSADNSSELMASGEEDGRSTEEIFFGARVHSLKLVDGRELGYGIVEGARCDRESGRPVLACVFRPAGFEVRLELPLSELDVLPSQILMSASKDGDTILERDITSKVLGLPSAFFDSCMDLRGKYFLRQLGDCFPKHWHGSREIKLEICDPIARYLGTRQVYRRDYSTDLDNPGIPQWLGSKAPSRVLDQLRWAAERQAKWFEIEPGPSGLRP